LRLQNCGTPMLSFLKRLKASYSLYNFFQKEKLAHNLPLFQKYGIKKQYFSSLSSKDFTHLTETHIPEVDLSALTGVDSFKALPASSKESLLSFNDKGFAVLSGFLSEAEVTQVNESIEQLLASGQIRFQYGNKKLMFAIHHSDFIRSMGTRPDLMEILGHLLSGPPLLFQSINFVHSGSEQKAHSDSIHMTTYPLGGLLGVWVALEDIDEENGPLFYYPGSHKLPYYLNSDYDNEGNGLLIGDKDYTAYEHMLEAKLAEANIQPKLFTAKAGDVLIWHANLMHGGMAHNNPNRTRKSMVFHYFRRDAICYHEITQRPALMDPRILAMHN